MKTRELLTCDTKVLDPRVRDLKPKELRRHIDRIAADLGVSDTDALLGGILDAVLGLADLPQGQTNGATMDEPEAILRSLEGQVDITHENKETVLRLIVIALAYLRHLMDRQIKESRRAQRLGHAHGHHHHHGHHCDDPNCTEHGGTPASEDRSEPGNATPEAPKAAD
jgi:hypothetical protein